jgi:hypothetical protein
MANMRKQSAVKYIKKNSDSMFTEAKTEIAITEVMRENFYQNPFTHQYFYIEEIIFQA